MRQIVVISKEGCGPCKELENVLIDIHKDNFHLFSLIFTQDTSRLSKTYFGFEKFPTIIILENEDKILEYQTGYTTKERLVNFLRKNNVRIDV